MDRKNVQSLRALWSITKKYNLHVIRALEKEKEEGEKVLKEIRAEKF